MQRGAEMVGSLRSWWQQIKQHLVVIGVIIACVLGIGAVMAIVGGYLFNWGWTGFSNKTLWEWLNPLGVLAIPVAITLGTLWFTAKQGKLVNAENKDNQQEAALQAYIDKMSELLLHGHLGESLPHEVEITIARARTATILRILNPSRCASLIQFLSQAGILRLCVENSAKSSFDWPIKNEYSLAGIELPETNFNRVDLSMIYLEGANLYRASLREANLEEIDLSGANLQGANLMHANLQKANLMGANLQGARLFRAGLQGADLIRANMERANLSGANLKDAFGVTVEELEKQALSLKDAIMPDGSIHP
jgi:uncharacterized protein YjbI with pentapeptide repeats